MPIKNSDALSRLIGSIVLCCASGSTLAFPCIQAYADGSRQETPLADIEIMPNPNKPGFDFSAESDNRTMCLDDMGVNAIDAMNTPRNHDGLGTHTSWMQATRLEIRDTDSIPTDPMLRINSFLMHNNELFTQKWYLSDHRWDDYEALTIVRKDGAYVVEAENLKRNSGMPTSEEFFADWSIPDGVLSHFTVLEIRER
jgi:hypothetical protein